MANGGGVHGPEIGYNPKCEGKMNIWVVFKRPVSHEMATEELVAICTNETEARALTHKITPQGRWYYRIEEHELCAGSPYKK